MKKGVIEFEELPSTNLEARKMIEQGCEPWTVVVAKKQGSGHGTRGKDWFSPEGGLYFSVILPPANIKDLQILTLLSAFAVASAIKEEFDLEPMIKLPNDVFVNGKKFCGILTENVIKGNDINSVIGIGIDTNIDYFPDELSRIATSVSNELGVAVDNDKIVEKVIENMRYYFNEITI
ncbi:MAG: biotin--[acetyl-CoA-carboxylase] ligase [Candidatus Paceibacterota bacterium]